MKKSEIPVVVRKSDVAIEGPAVVISRGMRSVSENESSFGAPKSTHIDCIDEAGNTIEHAEVLERSSRVGKLFQGKVEAIRVSGMQATLARDVLERSWSDFGA